MRKTLVCLLLVVGLVGSASAQLQWDGGGVDDDWHTQENWALDVVPAVGENCMVSGGFTAQINADVDTGRIDSAFYNSGSGHIIINSGDVFASGGIGLGQGNAGDTGQVTVNGGSLTLGGWGFLVGYQNGTGIFNMNDGLVDCGGFPLRFGFGTWPASDITRGYGYIYGGTVIASLLSLTDQGAGAGVQEGLLEFDGMGMILDGDVRDEINDHIAAGRISGLGGQTVVATWDEALDVTTVQIPEPATLMLLSCGLGLVARRRARR